MSFGPSSDVPSAGFGGWRDDGETVVECVGVSRTYTRDGKKGGWFRTGQRTGSRRVQALDGVNLAFGTGELTVIAGPSGSGKSTLLHLLAALDVPTGGQVFIDDTDTTALSERDRTTLRRQLVGIVFQRFHLLPSLSAQSNVAIPLIEEGLPKGRRHERAAESLTRVGLGERLDHKPYELSGGEQQRVAIARAIVNDPAIVLADEPTGELDSETGHRVLSILEDLAADRVVIVATHDQSIIERGDRVIRLADGRVIADG